LSKYRVADSDEEEYNALLILIKEYLILLDFISEYLFIENDKPLDIYQLFLSIFTRCLKFIIPIKIQEQFLDIKYQKLAIKILTKETSEQKDFITDLLSHGKSF